MFFYLTVNKSTSHLYCLIRMDIFAFTYRVLLFWSFRMWGFCHKEVIHHATVKTYNTFNNNIISFVTNFRFQICAETERRVRVEHCGERRSLMGGGGGESHGDPGVSPWIHLWVRRETLYSILNETGSQWSDLRMGVIWSYLRTLIRILAALFWMYCSFLRLLPGITMRSALQ